VIEHREIQRVGARNVDKLLARRVADAGTLDLDDVRAQLGEQLGACRARLHVGEIENFYAVERFHGGLLSGWR
jgi:hypothetical protein